MTLQMIELDTILLDPEQPRRQHDDEALQGLSDSIRQHGLLQPIVVRPVPGSGMFRIVVGERRWRAAQLAGLTEIPCLVREVELDDIVTEQLVENLQREELSPLDRARALDRLKSALHLTNRELGSRLGLSERTVAYALSLLDLPTEIGQQVVTRGGDGSLTEKHARYLTQLNDHEDLQQRVVEKVRSEGLTGEETGRLVRALRDTPDEAETVLSRTRDDWSTPRPPREAHEPRTTVIGDPITRAIAALSEIRPSDMTPSERHQAAEALTSLMMVAQGLITELSR